MPIIHVETLIDAPIELCFDLARSVNIHPDPPVAGVTSGLMELDDIITWESVHLGRKQTITSKISAMERPHRFVDVLIRGTLKKIIHEHIFETKDEKTLVIDNFEFSSLGGVFGLLLDHLLLKNYMRTILLKHNKHLKEIAESGQTENYIKPRIVSPGA
jgi:ligand-binding SRPBCC domain-containing protein